MRSVGHLHRVLLSAHLCRDAPPAGSIPGQLRGSPRATRHDGSESSNARSVTPRRDPGDAARVATGAHGSGSRCWTYSRARDDVLT